MNRIALKRIAFTLALLPLAASAEPSYTIATPLGIYYVLLGNACAVDRSGEAIYCADGPVYVDQADRAYTVAVTTETLTLTLLRDHALNDDAGVFVFDSCTRYGAREWVCEAPDELFSNGFEDERPGDAID